MKAGIKVVKANLKIIKASIKRIEPGKDAFFKRTSVRHILCCLFIHTEIMRLVEITFKRKLTVQ